MLNSLKKLWNINRFRISVMAILPMTMWWAMDRILPVHTEIMKYAAISWISYIYLGTIFLGIKFGPKVNVKLVGRGNKRHKLIEFTGKEYKEIYFAWIMGWLVAVPFVSGLIMNGVDPKNGGLIYAPFLMYHIICFIKDIPLSTIKLLPYLANGNASAPRSKCSASSVNSSHVISSSSNTVYNNTYTFGGFASNYHR